MNLSAHWSNLNPRYKRYIYVGTIIGTVILLFSILMPDSTTYRSNKQKVIQHVLTDTDTRKLSLQSLAAKVESTRTANNKILRQLDQLHSELNRRDGGGEDDSQMARELQKIRTKLDNAENIAKAANQKLEDYENRGFPTIGGLSYNPTVGNTRSDDDQGGIPIIPSMSPLQDSAPNNQSLSRNKPTNGSRDEQNESTLKVYATAEEYFRSTPDNTEPETSILSGGKINSGDSRDAAPLKIRSISGEDGSAGTVSNVAQSIQQKRSSIQPEEEDDGIYIPAGSIIEAVIIAGMDAPTSQSAKRNPIPALMRFKKEAILPNHFTQDIRECFLVTSGYGSLSSERAHIRGETISCVSEDGVAFESRFESWAVGSDGKTGVRGRLVTKAGAVIGRAMIAGFGEGMSKAFDRAVVPTINTSGGDSVEYQDVLSSDSLQSAAASGVGSAFGKIAEYYLDLADQLTPVIEIDGGRVINFVVQQGVTIKRGKSLQEPDTL